MSNSKNDLTLVGVGIGIGAVLTVILILVLGARPSGVNLGPIEFDIPTATAPAHQALASISPTRVLTIQATATPRPSIRGYVTISPQRETRHISLGAGELIVGTAVYFQDNFDQRLPPFTVFLIKGPIEMDVTIENGGWDHWVNVYDDAFVESLLAPKVKEVQQHSDYSIRGHRVVRLP